MRQQLDEKPFAQTGLKGKPYTHSALNEAHGFGAIYPKRLTSRSHPEHKVYPYLLMNMKIDRPNQVWVADITYIPIARGFMYLVAVMDWNSRKVLSWRLSNTLDKDFCVDALEEAINGFGPPDIFNTDQEP
jgi:putative transposase